MDGIPHPSLLTAFPRSVAIIDRRPEYARMLATLVTEQQPTSAVRTFADPDEAERWITSAPAPILVLVDVAAGRGAAMARAVTWRARRADVLLVALFDANLDDEVALARRADADASVAKPCCRADWARSFDALWRVPQSLAS